MLGITLRNGRGAEGSYKLKDDEKAINLLLILSDDRLLLTLSDDDHPEREFVFENEAKPDHEDYDDALIYGEFMFYDLNHDGRNEMLLALRSSAKRKWRNPEAKAGGSETIIVHLMNWCVIWCVGFAPEEGFWLADGEIRSSAGVSIIPSFDGKGEMFKIDGLTFFELQDKRLSKHSWIQHFKDNEVFDDGS